MLKKNIVIYFDFLSPFSYFLSLQLLRLQSEMNEVNLDWKPVVLAKLLNHWEIKAPAEVAPKREYLFRQSLRFAAKNKIPFQPPTVHPFNPLYALRLACIETHGGNKDEQQKTMEILWRNIWGQGKNPDNPEEIAQWLILEGLKGEKIMEESFQKNIKNQLKINTQEAIDHRVFGVPSCVVYNGVEEDTFWGNDALEDMILFLQNKDFLDRAAYKRIVLSTQMGSGAKLQL